MIKERLEQIYERVERAKARAGRREEVLLLAAVKGRPEQQIREAVACGIRYIGENRLAEAERHQDVLKGEPVIWEYIGKVQSRKIRDLVARFARIQSLEDLRHAEKISAIAGGPGQPYPVLIEVNMAQEETKQGIPPHTLMEFVERVCRDCPGVLIEGLTVMPPETYDPEGSRPYFARARTLFDQLASSPLPGVHATCLSMGTSQDFEIAIEEGATMIRLGRALFG